MHIAGMMTDRPGSNSTNARLKIVKNLKIIGTWSAMALL
jgi:hypothetical protein